MTNFSDAHSFHDGEPVFVLTASRSGSTLLRFILDSHPDLACPPETGIVGACAGLARSWSVLENAESGHSLPVNQPVSLPPHAKLAVRAAIDAAFTGYLRRRGKRRWCDKSLDSYLAAELIAQVYPEARFLCLFRHCMDVIASGTEVCPWGLHRFGFDPFVAQHPGNNVAAIGNYWLSCAQAILAFEETHQERCHRVRYEDLVTAPEETTAAIFSNLGVSQVPGITDACFQTAHEGGGPGDEKIWFTTGITSGSMGRGVSVPSAALPPPLREAINETLAKLDYRQVNDDWNSSPHWTDPRVTPPPSAAGSGAASDPAARQRAEAAATVHRIMATIASRDDRDLREIGTLWPSVATSTVLLVVQCPDDGSEHVRVDFGELGTSGSGADGNGEVVTTLIASASTWESLLDGEANVVTEITAGRLRCVNKRDAHRIRSDELHAVATLLGMARIPIARVASADAGVR
jgi:hypothetical protein